MRLLEIFCGTKSIGKVFEKNDWEVYSVDIEKRFEPTECINIFNFNYKKFDKKHFNHIHFSPPCIYMSQMQQSWYGRYKGRGENKYLFTPELHNEKLKESDLILHKVKEIIDYFNDITFTIENPYHNKFNNIINRNILNYPYEVVNYCMYDYPLKKPTAFLNNFDLKLKLCDKSHTHTKYKIYCGGSSTPKDNVYKIPELLCLEIFNQVSIRN
jgi:hypothetical protein